MKTRPSRLLIGIGTTLALIVPAAQAATAAVDNHSNVTSAQAANHFQVARNTVQKSTRDSQALAALNARWNAEAAAYRAQLSGTTSTPSTSLPTNHFQTLRNTSI
jgi:hypothetical protein